MAEGKGPVLLRGRQKQRMLRGQLVPHFKHARITEGKDSGKSANRSTSATSATWRVKKASENLSSTMNKTSRRILVVLPKTEFSINVVKGHIMYLNSSFPPSLFLEEFESQYSPRKSWKESYPGLELHAKKLKKN